MSAQRRSRPKSLAPNRTPHRPFFRRPATSPLDGGLGPALRDLARQAPVPVEVVANGDRLPDRGGDRRLLHRLRRPTNAVKHARATKVMLRAVHEGSRLVVAMVDDGRTVSQNARRDGRASGSPYRLIHG